MNELIKQVEELLQSVCKDYEGLVFTVPDYLINEERQTFVVRFGMQRFASEVTLSAPELINARGKDRLQGLLEFNLKQCVRSMKQLAKSRGQTI